MPELGWAGLFCGSRCTGARWRRPLLGAAPRALSTGAPLVPTPVPEFGESPRIVRDHRNKRRFLPSSSPPAKGKRWLSPNPSHGDRSCYEFVSPAVFSEPSWRERSSRFFAWEPPESTNGGTAEGGKMPLGLPLGTLVLLLIHPARQAEGQVKEINVEISLGKVSLTCPEKEFNWWDTKSDRGNTSTLDISTPDDQLERGGDFFCGQRTGKFWKIYLQIKGCKDCVELSFGLGAGIIVADLLLTLGVLLLVYFCSQKQQALFRPGAPRRLQGQQADQPPPVPNPDYEPIRKGQREVYAGLEPQAF